MTTDYRENLIHRYLLGELPEPEQTAFEQELLGDREKFEEVWATESRLVDSYVRGQMSRPDSDRFERSYLASPRRRERVAIAELFLQEIDRPVTPTVPWWSSFFASIRRPQLAFGAALAMLLLLSCGLGWLYVERTRLRESLVNLQNETQAERSSRQQSEEELARRAQETEKENTQQRQENERLNAELEQLRGKRQEPESPAILSFLLTPALTRGQNATPTQIPFVRGPLRLLMAVNGRPYPSYRFSLQTVEGREIFSQLSGVGSAKDRSFATMTVPAGKLAKGDYVLILSGRTAAGAIEEIDRYFFQVK
jgi:hypothetical protein